MDPSIPAIGFLGGLLMGLTGMGGGAVVTPLLIYVSGVRPVTAVGTNLVFAALTKIAGAWQHGRQGTVHVPTTAYLAGGSLPAALAGVALLELVRRLGWADADDVVEHVLGYTLVIVGFTILLLAFGRRGRASPLWQVDAGMRGVLTVLVGAVVGLLVGFTSVGSGSLVVPFLIAFWPLGAATVVGTDVLHGALLTGIAGAAHLGAGNVDLVLAPQLLLGSVPGIIIGSRLALWVPQRVLRSILSVVLIAVGARMA